MRHSHRPIKTNYLKQIRGAQFVKLLIENAWTILIILALLAVIIYSIYIQFAHHI